MKLLRSRWNFQNAAFTRKKELTDDCRESVPIYIFLKVQTQRRALLIPTVPRTLSPIKCGLKASCSVETFLGAHGFKQTTGQKPESIWAHEDCKTFGAWWETPPVSSARRLQLSCTCAKCFAVPPNPFLWKVGAGWRSKRAFWGHMPQGLKLHSCPQTLLSYSVLSVGKTRTPAKLEIGVSLSRLTWLLTVLPSPSPKPHTPLENPSFQQTHTGPSLTSNC